LGLNLKQNVVNPYAAIKKNFRIFFLFSFIFLKVSSAHSQVIIALLFGDKLNTDKIEFGLSGGLNQSFISNFYDASSKSGFNLGLYLNFKLSEKWFFRVEAVPKFPTGVKELKPYSLNDASLDVLFDSSEVTRKIKNIALPMIFRYRLGKMWFAESGPEVNLRTKAKDIFEDGPLSYEKNIEDDMTRFEFGWVAGINRKLSKQTKSAALGVRYYFGLTDIDKLTEGTQKNGVFQLLFSIPVGTGKKKEK
jgi:hypothetical protein